MTFTLENHWGWGTKAAKDEAGGRDVTVLVFVVHSDSPPNPTAKCSVAAHSRFEATQQLVLLCTDQMTVPAAEPRWEITRPSASPVPCPVPWQLPPRNQVFWGVLSK